MTKLILTNGDSTVGILRAAGVEDDILPWRDVLHEGRVIRCEDRFAFARMRAGEIAGAFGGKIENLWPGFEERETSIRNHAAFDHIEIWLEHDLYDQLQLLDMIDALGAADRHDDVYLAQADDYLGYQTPETILRFADRTRPVSEHMRHEAQRAWNLFGGDDCAALAEYARAPDVEPPLFPWLKPALQRFLAEYPDTVSGLSRTQRRALETVANGPMQVGKAFGVVIEREEAMFMGDLSFFRIIHGMAAAKTPAITGLATSSFATISSSRDSHRSFAQSKISLTDFGRALLAGEADFVSENGIDCWFGGHHATGHAPWRWDDGEQALVPP